MSISNNGSGKPLKWGIMGCGLISSDFVHAVLRKCEQPHSIQAVATSNSLERAQQFVTKLQVPNKAAAVKDIKAYGSYEELLADKEIEIVYIGILNETHCRWVCASLGSGKHVLCEKPMGLSLAEAQMIAEKAREKGLFVMEAFWTRFFPVNQKLRAIIDQGQFGRVKVISASLGLTLPPSRFRLDASECPAIDIGCYPVMFAMFCLGDRAPTAVRAQAVKNADGVDICGTFFLEFDDGQGNCPKASLMYTTEATCPNPAFVTFERGTVQIPDFFYCPTRIRIMKGKLASELMAVEEHHLPLEDDLGLYNFPNTSGLRYEADHVFQCIRAGLKESPVMGLDSSVRIAAVMEQIRHQIGIQFPAQDLKSNKCNV